MDANYLKLKYCLALYHDGYIYAHEIGHNVGIREHNKKNGYIMSEGSVENLVRNLADVDEKTKMESGVSGEEPSEEE